MRPETQQIASETTSARLFQYSPSKEGKKGNAPSSSGGSDLLIPSPNTPSLEMKVSSIITTQAAPQMANVATQIEGPLASMAPSLSLSHCASTLILCRRGEASCWHSDMPIRLGVATDARLQLTLEQSLWGSEESKVM
ncbi:unnamed protein product [Protopolystoma xenopodis]|uniref:Uncharacterized protein n=1 Tax=Protopolystoma xenopodis TaxID=117903 RepID=A0A3S5FGG8_9PLAT|nr:unnamed protein product [Protopolystoma xenopodis]